MTVGVGSSPVAIRTALEIALAVLAGLGAPAAAREPGISIPPTSLDRALTALARSTGSELISTEPGLGVVRSHAVDGAMSVSKALTRLLSGTGFEAVRIGSGSYRIVRWTRRAPAQRFYPLPQKVPEGSPAGTILVQASKQKIALLRYPGSLIAVPSSSSLGGRPGDLAVLSEELPVLQGTHLGAGRDKLFIRGVADSSFSGSTQSPTSTYLDDVQLNYAGPDPGLRLYDMSSIEVLEGPQGTLYGGGAIGGVLRLTSNAVDLAARSSWVSIGTTATRGGELGADGAVMLNLPVEPGRLGVRVVAYAIRDGGYIDDTARKLANVNSTSTKGGRVSVRFDPSATLRIEGSGVAQGIDAADGQYAERSVGVLARRSMIPQPFDNRLLLGRLAVSKELGDRLRLFSASGVVFYHSTDNFDATPFGAVSPITYHAVRNKRLFSQETRLSQSRSDGNSWVAGFTLVSDTDILGRSIGSQGMPATILGVTNVTKAASFFTEGTVALLPGFSTTVGARLTRARVDGEPSSTPRSSNFVRGRSTLRLDPTLAASWLVRPNLAMFARFQTGYRTGGLAVATGVGRVTDFRSDTVVVGEVGFRKLRSGPTGLAASTSLSLTHWTQIQADLINRRGLPYTTNLGDARIFAAEAMMDWVPMTGVKANVAILYTENEVRGPIADLSIRQNRRLPETPPLALHAALYRDWSTVSAGLTADYVGRSVLGTGDLLDVSQGKYTSLGAAASLRLRSVTLNLKVDNLTNRHANQFSFGNPFALASREQTTPLRPQSMRVGIATRW